MKVIEKLFCVSLFAVTALLTGCADVSSSQVSSSAIYVSYGANYDEASGQAQFTATFTVGGALGTYVQLDSKSSVTLDGQEMIINKDIFDQIVYEYDLPGGAGQVASLHTFIYRDDSGDVYTNVVYIPNSITVSASQQLQASVESPFQVDWSSSSPLSGSDSISATLQGQVGTVDLWSSSGGSSGEISVTPQQMRSVGVGSASLQICDQRSTVPSEAGASGGAVTLSYCAAPVTIQISS